MSRPRSLRAAMAIGALLWSVGLFVGAGIVITDLFRRYPSVGYGFHQPFTYVTASGAVVLACLVAGWFQVRRPLSVLERLRAGLSNVHAGRETHVPGEFPPELRPLVDDLNALLVHREQMVRRALSRAGDLAHGLKTPLAVMAHEADRIAGAQGAGRADVLRSQVDRMRRQIDYHLAHARAAASGAMPGASCDVSVAAEGLVRTLDRLHAGRGLTLRATVPPGVVVRAQREDLDEMLGNLLDNACTWGRSAVEVTSRTDGGVVEIAVDDDGPGVAPALRTAVLRRGVRADEAAPGSGLGLAIVADLAELYGGAIVLESSPLGGTPETASPATASRTARGWRPMGLLAPGRTHDDAHAQVVAIATALAEEHPETNRAWTVRVVTTRAAMGGANTWLVLSMLSTVVGLLLLLACANITNLLIARLLGRRQELAVRTALGATGGRIVRQIVGESLVLGLAGGLLGLAVAAAGLEGVHAMASEPFFKQITLDGRVVLFAAGLALVAPLVFAIVPTIGVLRRDVRPALNDSTLRSIGTASLGRSTLVVFQVSLAVTLLVVSALVVQSVRALTHADLGYDPARLLAAQIDVPDWKVADDVGALALRQRIVDRALAIPGVQAAALVTALPALHFAAPVMFDVAGRTATTENDRPSADLTITTTGYFHTFGIPMVAGRGFEPADAATPRAVAVISAETARRYWGSVAAAVGADIRLPGLDGRPPLDATIVGVARDTANPDLDAAQNPVMFLLDEHRPARATHVVVSAEAPARLASELRQAIRDVDPDMPAFQLRTVAEGFADEMSSSRLLGALFAAFAAVAVLLATAGLYGVVSYSVSERIPEIAMRMALGASAREIASDVVGRSVKLAALGAIVGLGGAFMLANAMTAVLFGVSAGDPGTYAAAVAVALSAAVAASLLPMLRAATVDPIQSLRRA